MRLTIGSTWDARPAPADRRVRVSLTADAESVRIGVDAPWCGGPPPAGPPGPTPALWEHEVVEVFFAGPGERYTEVELGPFGHHLVLQLDGVRRVVADRLPLAYEAELRSGPSGRRWRGRARLARHLLPAGPLRVNAYAIQPEGAGVAHLAWSPPGGARPDFHRLDSFRPIALF